MLPAQEVDDSRWGKGGDLGRGRFILSPVHPPPFKISVAR